MWRIKLYILLGVIFLVVFFQLSIRFIQGEASRIIILWPNPEVAKPNLQLYTFPYITIPVPNLTPGSTASGSPSTSGMPGFPSAFPYREPGPGGYCPVDTIKKPGSTCGCIDFDGIACPIEFKPGGPPMSTVMCNMNNDPSMPGTPMLLFGDETPGGLVGWYCTRLRQSPSDPVPPGCFDACIAKPVVYLYPKEPTFVSVSVRAQGEVFVSDPLYPKGGWKDVLAHPDGTLWYQGKKYRELFYETSVTKKVPMPDTGMVIPIAEIEETLAAATTRLGLVGIEQEEFLEFWVPTLQKLRSPYIFFSILPPDIKESYDHLDIHPSPDTRIEFIAYFKPLAEPIAVPPLQLPEIPPERIGFTEVEWGGTIGH